MTEVSVETIQRMWIVSLVVYGVVLVVVAVLSYQLYQDRKKPEGVQINIGPSGVSIEKK
jgi:RsiW-degrading membrane proteinase PrsW (M82 family)